MRPSRRRLLKVALITLVSAAILIAAAGPILSSILNKKVKAKLEAADIRISSLNINLFTRSITIEDLEWSDKATVKNVHAGGIRIIPFLRNGRLSIKKLSFENGSVSLVSDTTHRNERQDSVTIKNIKSLDIDRITIDNIAVKFTRDSVVEYQGTVGLIVHHIFLDSLNAFRDPAAYKFRNIETTVADLRIQKKGALSEFRIKLATFDKELMKLHIDSLELRPLLSKTDFAKKVKSQDTRLTLAVPRIDATGVNMAIHMQDTSIMIQSITIDGARVHAYKNKKYPFTRKKKFPLPMESFRALPIGFEIDTVNIHNADITYEELPIEGFHYAWIQFEHVEATMNAVSNTEYKNMSGFTTIEASAHVMKTGQVKAMFKVPLAPDKRYTAEGTITDVPLKELNPLLKDLAFIEITSGKLNRMNFAFSYDDIGSKGQLDFEYQDLRILGLKKERIKDVNQLKTILLNTALKDGQTVTGNIDAIRNQRKAVFNLWSISLADGIRNALMPRRSDKKDNKGKK